MNAAQISFDYLNPFSLLTTSVNVDRDEAGPAHSGSDQGEIPTYKQSHDDARVIQALKSGDEATFGHVVESYHGGLLRLARTFVTSEAVAEEVVQDTWMAVLEGIQRFEGRSSFKTWVYRILTNRAKTRAVREARYVSFLSYGSGNYDDHEETVGPSAFHQTGNLTGSWIAPPTSWDDFSPERLALSKESLEQTLGAVEKLPPLQKQALLLRDVDGLDAGEVCQILNLSDTHQRVLLHRARGKVRQALDAYIKG